MNNDLIESLEKFLQGKIAYHKANIGVYLKNSVGIGEHPDIMNALEEELEKLADADEKLSTLKKYFNAQ